MTSPNLENLARTGELQAEPPAKLEFDGLVASALSFLGDARKPSLAVVSRFNLAYEAAHALSLAALRWHGYRSNNRYMVFQVLEHTLGFKPADWRILADCHKRRNLAVYEGSLNVDDRLLNDLIEITGRLLDAVEKLGPVAGTNKESYPRQ